MKLISMIFSSTGSAKTMTGLRAGTRCWCLPPVRRWPSTEPSSDRQSTRLNKEKGLAGVLDEAGGVTVAAALEHITVERIDAHQQRETIGLSLDPSNGANAAGAAIAAFEVKDGDRVRVVPILPYSERVIYVDGHVVRPGRVPYRDGMRLNDVLHSYQDLLPEPAVHGELIRLVPPDLHAETIGFDVPDVLIGNSNLTLQPFDTIRVFGRYEQDAPNVSIRGEVMRPGAYALSEGMTAAQLVRMAGGFKRDALLGAADLISYRVLNGVKAVEESVTTCELAMPF